DDEQLQKSKARRPQATLSGGRTPERRNCRERRLASKPSRQGPRHRARPRRVRAQPPSSRGSKHLGERSIDDTRATGKPYFPKKTGVRKLLLMSPATGSIASQTSVDVRFSSKGGHKPCHV